MPIMGGASGLTVTREGERGDAATSAGAASLAHDAGWLVVRVVAPIGLGLATYLGRSTQPSAVALVPRSITDSAHGLMGPVVVGCPSLAGVVPDAAWAFALGSMLRFVWRAERRWARAAWLWTGAVLAVGYELAQFPHWAPGTFTPADLVASAVAYAAAVIVIPH